MDTKKFAHDMYTEITAQQDEIYRDPVKVKCGHKPRLYFFAQKQFWNVCGVKSVGLAGPFVHLQCENEEAQSAMFSLISDAAKKIRAELSVKQYTHVFDGVKYYSVSFADTPLNL